MEIWVVETSMKDYNSENMKSNVSTLPISNSSNPSKGVLNVKCGDLIWVGYREGYSQNNTGLGGSIDKLYYNGERIPFWKFYSQPPSAICYGAFDG